MQPNPKHFFVFAVVMVRSQREAFRTSMMNREL